MSKFGNDALSPPAVGGSARSAAFMVSPMETCAYFPPPEPESDICLLCGLEGFGCVCDPANPYRPPTPAELERGRNARLTRAEVDGAA